MSGLWRTADGQVFAWSDVSERHLWNIARMVVRDIRRARKLVEATSAELDAYVVSSLVHEEGDELQRRAYHALESPNAIETKRRVRRLVRKRARLALQRRRADMTAAFAELARRDLLPTVEDLRVAWDRACGGNGGLNHANDPEKRPWCLVELWVGYRGMPTFTPEWLAAQRTASGDHSEFRS